MNNVRFSRNELFGLIGACDTAIKHYAEILEYTNDQRYWELQIEILENAKWKIIVNYAKGY